MEKTSIKILREKIKKVQNDAEKRREICGDFFLESEREDQDKTRCSRCGKVYQPGERRFRFQGTFSDFCDTCFCDEMEALVYEDHGFHFENDEGGGTIWVSVEGEEPIFPGR